METSKFKKIIYIVTAIAIIAVSYLAFFRINQGDDSATSRSANFLGLKTGAKTESDVSNQKELTIDSNSYSETNNVKDGVQSTTSSATGKVPGFYTVKDGDTYGCIAEANYGSYEHWQDILNVNSGYGQGFGEYQLHVGAVLELPAITAVNLKPASKLCS